MTTDNGPTIYEVVRQLEEAWNSSDSKRFAAAFTEDADFINILGNRYNGREVIDASHREIFDTTYKDSRNQYTIESVRFVRPDVVVVFVKAALETSDGRSMAARPTMLLTKDNGKWQVSVLQNTVIANGQRI